MSTGIRPSVALVAAAAALAACRGAPEAPTPPADVRYDGATSISRKILPHLATRLRERTGAGLDVDRSGAGSGLKRLFAREVNVAGVSRRLTPQELARKPHFQIIGYDALGVWVNDSNPVRALTKAQVKALFTGAITNWGQVGGRNTPVVPCTERLASARATLDSFQSLALDGAPYGRTKELEDPADCLAFVASEPGGVAAATVAYSAQGARTVSIDGLAPVPSNVRSGRYLLTHPLLLVTLDAPRPGTPVSVLLELAISPASAGFVPAR